MKHTVFLLLLIINTFLQAADDVAGSYKEKALEILKKTYPSAVLSLNENGLWEFSDRTRSFTMVRADKVGNWQKEHQEVGPDKDGIMVSFKIVNRNWEGAMVLPHSSTDDNYVFSETLVVKEAKDQKSYIWAQIKTPRFGSNSNMLNELKSLFNSFE